MIKLKNNFLRKIGTLSRTINYTNDTRNKKFNLQKGQYIFLTRIVENPGISFKDLTMILNVDKTTTTKAVQKLIQVGYIEKKLNQVDHRVYNLYPTKQAESIYNKLIESENIANEVCFNGFTNDEIILVKKLIDRINKNIEISLNGGQ